MPKRGILSVEKAKEPIGYSPEYPLDRGFVQYIKWDKSFVGDRAGGASEKEG